jgi:nitrogen fixation NifU-like protein
MSELRELYQEVILDHNKRPRNFRRPESVNCEAEGYNPLCGDHMTLYLFVEDGVIRDVGFEGSGCAVSKASASMMTEALKGKTLAEAESLFEGFRSLVTGRASAGGATGAGGTTGTSAGISSAGGPGDNGAGRSTSGSSPGLGQEQGATPAGSASPPLGKLAVFSGVSEFPMRVKCATLAWHTMRAALEGKKDAVSTE